MKYKVIEDDQISTQYIQNALELDRKYYFLTDSDQFNLEKCKKWYEKNKKIYTIITDENDNVVAYINAAPVNQKAYSDIRNGLYSDSNINDDDIVPYSSKNEYYNLYFASIVIDFENVPQTVLIPLLNTFIEKVIDLIKHGYIVRRVIADAISEEGKNLCERSGFKKVTETKHGSTVYEFDFFPPPANFRTFSPKLKELYNLLKEKYDELKNKTSSV